MLARRLPGGHARFLVLLIALAGALMVAYRFAPAGLALFCVGMCAGFFLSLTTYGPALALIQGPKPAHMRSTVTGVTMLSINIFAIAIGNALPGAVIDRLAAAGSNHPLTTVLLAIGVLTFSAAGFFALAARGLRLQATSTPMFAHRGRADITASTTPRSGRLDGMVARVTRAGPELGGALTLQRMRCVVCTVDGMVMLDRVGSSLSLITNPV